MRRLHIAPIVEGHGEVAALPVLLRRIASEFFQDLYIEIERPFRVSRTKIIRRMSATAPGAGPELHPGELDRAVQFAESRLANRPDALVPSFVLVLLDAEDDCPKKLIPRLKAAIKYPNVECVLANISFETWLTAGSSTLGQYLKLSDTDPPLNPEGTRSGKKWIEDRIRQPKYSETVDQPRLTHAMNLQECRSRSASFDKLCRVIEAKGSS